MTYIGKINSGESQSRISSINPRFIGKKDLIKIVEVEQDMWAREEGVGEYVKCDCCGKIYSKENIFGHLERKLKVQTVAEIERALGGGKPICLECGEETRAIYDRNEYIEQVIERYKDSVESFLTVYRDENGEIRGFIDGYVDNFEHIYRREFEHNYGAFGIEGLKGIITGNLGIDLPYYMLLCSALGMEEGYKNFNIVYEIMKVFFQNIINSGNGDIMGIYEAPIGTNAHSIYHVAGGKMVGLSKDKKLYDKVRTKPGQINDIFIHQRAPIAFVTSMSIPPKDYLRSNLGKMREVLKVA